MPNTKACLSRMTLLSVAAAVCIIVFLFPRSAFGQSVPQVSISTTASSGFLYGSGFEYVYNQQVSTNYKNSELDWPFQFLFYSGETLALDTSFGVFARLDVKEAVPGNVGTMTDSDFLNGDGARTHYSQSDSYAERALLFDGTVGYELPLRGAFGVGLYAAFSYMDFKWSARDGYYQYPTSGSQYYFNGSGTLVPGH